MPDLFDDFNKVFKKDLVPFLVKYFKDSNNKLSNNINDFLNDPRISLTDFFEKFSKNNNDISEEDNEDIENLTYVDALIDDEYDLLLRRLTIIEENMIQIEKKLNPKIEKY